jgi:hypothetical protein
MGIVLTVANAGVGEPCHLNLPTGFDQRSKSASRMALYFAKRTRVLSRKHSQS